MSTQLNIVRPVDITANRQNVEMIVHWSDGHVSKYPFSLLRHACPCAQCRGGHDKMGAEPDPGIFYLQDEDSPATRLRTIEAVGAYAITIEWEDGHNYGIYTWHYLRALCPCDECRVSAVYGE
jgi:DUF971 family protein